MTTNEPQQQRAREAEGLTAQLFEVEGFGDYTNAQQREAVYDLALNVLTTEHQRGVDEGLEAAARIVQQPFRSVAHSAEETARIKLVNQLAREIRSCIGKGEDENNEHGIRG